jgi:DNA repair protein RadA/Sms
MFCKHCHTELPEDRYKCVICGRFNVAPEEEELVPAFKPLADVDDIETVRLTSKHWWAPILGGGLVARQLILIGGDPGAGKSTWSLMLAEACAVETGRRAALIPTEEDEKDVKTRVKQLGLDSDCFLIPSASQDETLACLEGADEDFSIVMLDSLPDLIGDDPNEAVRVLDTLKEYAKAHDVPILVIDHANKGDELAGLKRLQHKVDTTIYMKREDGAEECYMTCLKNRFGQAHKVIELVMQEENAEQPGLLYPKPGSELNEKLTLAAKKRRLLAKSAISHRKGKSAKSARK